jgi:hypothetical protein
MGAERWLQFSSVEEADKVRAYLPKPDMGGTEFERPYFWIGKEGKFICWVKWESPTTLWVSHPVDVDSSELALLVCRELAKRFVVVGFGSDAVGWYKDQDPCLKEHGYTTWIDWLTRYDSTKDRPRVYRIFRPIKGIERFVVKYFKELDAANSSIEDAPVECPDREVGKDE